MLLESLFAHTFFISLIIAVFVVRACLHFVNLLNRRLLATDTNEAAL